MPSKFWIGAESGPLPRFFWTTGSFAPDDVPFAAARCSLSRALSVVTTGAFTTGRLDTTGETPWNWAVPTCGPRLPVVCSAEAALVCRTALDDARWMPST